MPNSPQTIEECGCYLKVTGSTWEEGICDKHLDEAVSNIKKYSFDELITFASSHKIHAPQ